MTTTRATEWRGFRAYPTKPHDGDSFWVMADTSFGDRHEPELRLVDVHAPELRQLHLPPMFQPGGQEATGFVNDWLAAAQAAAPGRRWFLWVETVLTRTFEPEQKTTLSRYLARVWPFEQRPAPGTPGVESDTLNSAVTLYLAGHPDWPPGE